ncbi:transcriptional regulator [Yinghuangia sp. YIM S10712]|uniref:transcriptional regulator n=1 Tax=Yinghuangia sp. YIM S10712 TaxID=3436930 RepID=UPI003F53A3EC
MLPTDALLTLLADDRHATGVLLSSTGALYLRRGEVVHAESPAAPTLDALLTAGGRLTPEAWRRAVDHAGGDSRVAQHLVDQHRISTGELEIAHLATLFDAAYFTLAPDSGPVRFRPGAAHWLGAVRPVAAHTVARECLRRRGLLESVFPDARIDLCPVRRREAAPEPRTVLRRAVLGLADGVRTPGTIAHLLGRPAFHILVEVRRMAAAGLVAPPPGTAQPTRTDTPSDTPADTAANPPDPPSPRPAWAATTEPPDIELLRRIRDALEARL